MSNRSGSAGFGTALMMFGGLGIVSSAITLTTSGGGLTGLVPAVIMVSVGLAIRKAARRRNTNPRLPQGFSPARADSHARGAESAAAESEKRDALYAPDTGDGQPQAPSTADRDAASAGPNPTPSPQQAQPAEPSPPPATTAPVGSDRASIPEPAATPSSTSPEVPSEVQAQVAELRTQGRTVQAIEVLREATGMELYEASQYVLALGTSGDSAR